MTSFFYQEFLKTDFRELKHFNKLQQNVKIRNDSNFDAAHAI